MSNLKTKTLKHIAKYAIDRLKDSISSDHIYGCDLHNEIFNMDYFIVGYYHAEQWLIKHTGIFAAIKMIQDYEKINFGEVTTNLSNSENVCNMVVYIIGEDILNTSKNLQKCWDTQLSDEDIKAIIRDLKKQYSI